MRAAAARAVRWIGHCGLARHRPGGAPNAATLEAARGLCLDWVEVDVRVTLDGALVAHHDARLRSGERLADRSLRQVRRAVPGILTLDEAVEASGDGVRLLLDVKSPEAVPVLGRWLARRRPAALAVCSPDHADLAEFRRRAPRVSRWLSLPRYDAGPLARIASASAAVRLPARGAPALGAVRAAAAAVGVHARARSRVAHAAARAWRRALPQEVARAARGGARPAAVSVDQWAMSGELCEVARRAGIAVAAWTVNSPHRVQAVRRCGVDLITTDDVVGMRLALAGFA